MRLSTAHEAHLTYCTNVHPGESLDDVVQHVRGPVAAVKHAFCPKQSFGVGLRISAATALSLESPTGIARLRDVLAERDAYLFTINGFPYGNFHTGRVKENVYLPDWSEPERQSYTQRLAEVLAELLPESTLYGSISTVPGCFRPLASPERVERIRHRLIEQVAALWKLRERTGRRIVLGLEPEPHCMLETTSEAVSFIQDVLSAPSSLAFLATKLGTSAGHAEAALREHLGVCLDACHSAVAFESPRESVTLLRDAGICIAKLQLSVAPRAPELTAETLEALGRLNEGTYLHQVVVRDHAGLKRFLDVPDALLQAAPGQEWRVHYHVPIFHERFGALDTTRSALAELLEIQRREPFTQHLEVETYTWGILDGAPDEAALPRLIADELRWAWTALGGGVEPAGAVPPGAVDSSRGVPTP